MSANYIITKMELLDKSKDVLNPPLAVKLLTYNLFLRPPGIKTNQDDYKN